MKRGESSNRVDWPAGRMVLDMTLESVLRCFVCVLKNNDICSRNAAEYLVPSTLIDHRIIMNNRYLTFISHINMET